ncbi:glycerate kinase, partial [Pseudomonas aeruginosa]|uniref:glycerate kinase n=1 Tax=Pseudomonas aeruginosa TaxID=287 RepID=UPI00396A0685
VWKMNHPWGKTSSGSVVLTGEGRLDEQTLYGKTPAGVAVIASAAGVPVVAIAGTLGVGYQRLRDIGIVAAFSITSGPMTGRIEKTEKIVR